MFVVDGVHVPRDLDDFALNRFPFRSHHFLDTISPPPRSTIMTSVSPGTVYSRPGSPHWFIKYYVDGVPKRETTGTPNRDEAEAMLRRRIEEAERGLYRDIGQRITFTQMTESLLRNYAFKQNRTDPRRFIDQLAKSFGTLPGEEITEERIAEHSRKRLEVDLAKPATLHRELAVLRRMLRLASPKLPRVPLIDMPRVYNARQGFFEEGDVQAILPHLPPHARHLIEFLYLTGWRSSEAFRLQWSDIDWKRRLVQLATRRTASRGSSPSSITRVSNPCSSDSASPSPSGSGHTPRSVRRYSTGMDGRSSNCAGRGPRPAARQVCRAG